MGKSRVSIGNVASQRREWARAVILGLCAAVPVLLLYAYWFAFADRYLLFLYFHDMGPLVPDTAPFSRVTSSRYWMAGLVAGGVVLVANTCAHWLIGRLRTGYRPATWWRAWLIGAPLLVVAIPMITMGSNQPTLPANHAALTTMVALIGLGLGLLPAGTAADRPRLLILLCLDGVALALAMFGIAMIERIAPMLSRGVFWPLILIVGSLVSAVAGLLFVTGLRHILRSPRSSARELFCAGLCIAYPLAALSHHLYVGLAEGYWYISDSDNFFSRSWGLQIAAWAVAGALAGGITHLRGRLSANRNRRRPLDR